MTARTGLFVAPLPGSTPQGTSPTDGRLVLGGLFGTVSGCVAGGAISASATAMQLTVAQAVWRIPDPTNAAAVFLSPADPYTFTLSAGPASGSRIDVLWVKQDNFENGDADSRVTYGVAAGTAAATPVAPSIPAGAMKIAQVSVPTSAANAAACTVVTSFGGSQVAAPAAVVGAQVNLPATGQYIGQRAYSQQSGLAVEYRWNGTAWKPWESDFLAFTPSVDLGSGGNGTGSALAARYRGGRVLFQAFYAIGSGGSMGAYLRLSIPGGAADIGTYPVDGNSSVVFKNASDNYRTYTGTCYFDTNTTIRFLTIGWPNQSSNAGIGLDIGSTFPFNEAWGAGDQAHVTIEYDLA
jgi:hypothetical protein